MPHSAKNAADRLDDVVILDATVLTMDPRRPTARAVALRAGRILAVGDEEEVRARLAPGARTVRAPGTVLLPAFHDAHLHLTQLGLELAQVDLHGAADLNEGLERVAERARSLPEGAWVLGAGFSLQRWNVTALDRTMLDRVAPRNPVLLRSQDHHSAWANGRALELAGVSAATPDPENGAIVRDERGEPTGMLLERALHLVMDRVPPPDAEGLREALEGAGRFLAAQGVATVHHMAYEPVAYWRELALAASGPDFPVRVWACIDQENIEHAAALGIAGGLGGDGFTVGGAKFFADGALGSRTAWMLEPYAGTDGHGLAVHGPEVLAERYPLAIEAGLAPVTHAIGDAANRAVIDALQETAPQWRSRGLRPRLEHAQHLAPGDVERVARLGIAVSMQPIHLTFDVPSISALLPDRRDRAYRMAALEAAGARLAFGSDAPVARPDVLAGLRAACRREGVDGSVLCAGQALEPMQAVAAYTTGAAWAIGREDRSGMIAPGFDADLVLLSADPRTDLDGLEVLATIRSGTATYDREGLLGLLYTRA